MEPCEHTSRVGAYYDGELSTESVRWMETHLQDCESCRSELESLRAVSHLFQEPDSEAMTPLELARVRREACRQAISDQEPVLRLFGGLLAVAASILVICGAWWFEAPRIAPRPAYAVHETPAWERVAVDLRVDPEPFFGREATAAADPNLAEWMLNGLSNREKSP